MHEAPHPEGPVTLDNRMNPKQGRNAGLLKSLELFKKRRRRELSGKEQVAAGELLVSCKGLLNRLFNGFVSGAFLFLSRMQRWQTTNIQNHFKDKPRFFE